MLLPWLTIFTCCSLGVRCATILEIVRQDPQLSSLASLVASTGKGVSNPDIDDRFGGKGQREFTLFAPSNEAFKRIAKPALDQLALPQNYPLVLSLLRAHFVEGRHELSLATTSDATLKSVEGYPIVLSRGENGMQIENHYYRSRLDLKAMTAENGVIYKIDRMIDPFAPAFGVAVRSPSGKASIVDLSPRQEEKTMTELVKAEPQLSNWTSLIEAVLPAIMKRLGDRRGPEGGACKTPFPFAALPLNEAFDRLPVDYTKILGAPFNFALASHLLAWGISVPTCATFEDIVKAIRTKGSYTVHSHRADMNLTITETAYGSGELLINNARVVTANRCAGNGCVWIVDRLIDPVYGIF